MLRETERETEREQELIYLHFSEECFSKFEHFYCLLMFAYVLQPLPGYIVYAAQKYFLQKCPTRLFTQSPILHFTKV
jgi:hypothetical protein